MFNLKKAMKFDRQHLLLNNASHAAGGFGLALILQNYTLGNPFLPISVGWVLLGFSLIVHLYSWTR